MKYRKKPVEIDAWLISKLAIKHDGYFIVPEVVANAIDSGTLNFVANGVYIKTLEGGMFGRLEDWLIRGVAGEFYACKPDIFEQTYERVQ